MVVDRSKLLKTVGWTLISIGLYMVAVGNDISPGEFTNTRQPDDDIIDAVFTVVDD